MKTARPVATVATVATIVAFAAYVLRADPRPARSPHARTSATAPRDPAPEPAVALQPVLTRVNLTAPEPSERAPELDERALMASLRALGPADAERSLQLAREGNARFPNSPDAAERGFLVVKSLDSLGRFHEARVAAQLMVQSYPGTTWAEDVERHSLVYPLDQPSREEQQELDREERALR